MFKFTFCLIWPDIEHYHEKIFCLNLKWGQFTGIYLSLAAVPAKYYFLSSVKYFPEDSKIFHEFRLRSR